MNGIVGGARGCTGLTERGFEQARALRDRFAAEGFEADVLLASSLPRAVQTAETVGESLGLEPVIEPDLVEWIPGDIDGSTWDEWRELYAFDLPNEPDRPISPNGESINVFSARVERTLDRLADTYVGQTVVACCHGGVVFGSLVLLLGADRTRVSAETDFASVTEWRRELGRWTLVRYNDTAHLDGTGLLD